MLVYRITISKFARSLKGSGFPARWNPVGSYMLYTASSASLACLENLVHRSGEELKNDFKIVCIEIPNALKIETIPIRNLPKNWELFKNYNFTQKQGDEWLKKSKSAILKIPSAIIANEVNFLINPAHRDAKKIKIKSIESFKFDPRLKN